MTRVRSSLIHQNGQTSWKSSDKEVRTLFICFFNQDGGLSSLFHGTVPEYFHASRNKSNQVPSLLLPAPHTRLSQLQRDSQPFSYLHPCSDKDYSFPETRKKSFLEEITALVYLSVKFERICHITIAYDKCNKIFSTIDKIFSDRDVAMSSCCVKALWLCSVPD